MRKVRIKRQGWDPADWVIVGVLVLTTIMLYGNVLRAVIGW